MSRERLSTCSFPRSPQLIARSSHFPSHRRIQQQRPGQEGPQQRMKIKERITRTFYGPGIKETPELAVPKEKPQTRHTCMAKHYFLRRGVKLHIKAIQFRQDKKSHQ